MAPKVSIVTVSYNRPALLRAAVESVRAQTDPDWEHLIFDNGSTDPAVEPVLAWALEDPRARVWRWKENLNQPSVLWNYMMDRAHGRYLTVLDDDNEKLPTFVSAMSAELDADPGLDVITCGWRVDREEGGPQGPYYLNLSTSAERLMVNSTCDGGAMLYRRETFEHAGYFSEALRTNEDWDWLRRAVHNGRVKNLHDVHSTYRTHMNCRMRQADALGNDADVISVKSRQLSSTLGAGAHFPLFGRLTQSQRDVCSSLKDALDRIPWVTRGKELAVVVSPFQSRLYEIVDAVSGYDRAVSIHMEDPYALTANMERVRCIAGLVRESWVCTNDTATVPYYRKLVGDRVIVCPSLSADSSIPAPDAGRERDIDVLVCGYAYPSRKRFMSEFLPLLAPEKEPYRDENNELKWRALPGRQVLRVLLVGDGWEDFASEDVEMMPTQPLLDTYRLHARARAVVCLHRVHGDCSDGAVEPHTLNRGYLEGYSGARVFVDESRPHHSLDKGDVEFYEEPRDLADKLRWYFNSGISCRVPDFAEKCRLLYTYRTRLARIINCVRSPRFLVEIP